jgi:branched-chain amino acid transport system substrate-binding protein
LAQVVKDKLNAAGVTEVLFEGINPGEKDYTAVVTKLKNAGAEFVYFGGYHAEAGLILRQAADQGAKFQLMTGDSIATSEFWAMSGQAGEGTLFTFPTDPRRSPSAAKALEQFKAQGYDPEGFTLFSYGVVQAIPEGIKRSGSDDPAKIAAALEDGKPIDTVVGPVRLDSKGDILDPRYDINMWSAGKYADRAVAGRAAAIAPRSRGPLGDERSMRASKTAGVSHWACGQRRGRLDRAAP